MIVQSLDISGNHFKDDDAERIAEVLSKNTTLQELDFSNNDITTRGAIAISESLQDILQHLKMSWNNYSINTNHSTINFSQKGIKDIDVRIVTKVLCKNKPIDKLNLSQNKRITVKGI